MSSKQHETVCEYRKHQPNGSPLCGHEESSGDLPYCGRTYSSDCPKLDGERRIQAALDNDDSLSELEEAMDAEENR